MGWNQLRIGGGTPGVGSAWWEFEKGVGYLKNKDCLSEIVIT